MLELARLDAEQYREAGKRRLTVVLDNVRSEMNVGNIFRTADAFRVERIILCGITSVPPRQEIHKTALGAEETVEWTYYKKTEEAIEQLRKEGYVICSIEQVHDSVSLEEVRFEADKFYAVVFGNEVKGVGQSVVDSSDMCIEIPQFGTKHSLNVANTASIVIWQYFTDTKNKN